MTHQVNINEERQRNLTLITRSQIIKHQSLSLSLIHEQSHLRIKGEMTHQQARDELAKRVETNHHILRLSRRKENEISSSS